MDSHVLDTVVLVFLACAALTSITLFLRQPLIVAYVLVGCILGPYGLGWAADAEILAELGELGIVFLLFIVGMDLAPRRLKAVFSESALTAAASAVAFFGIGFGIFWVFDFSIAECVIAGIAAVFSSTIIGIKLLPTTVLHHRRIGGIVIGVLLIQDLLAILALIAIKGQSGEVQLADWLWVIVMLPVTVAVAALGARFVVVPLFKKFDVFTEYLVLLSIGWCLGIAWLAEWIGLSMEIGAFIAGVSLASISAAPFVTAHMTHLRDFFLILFFFAVGAALDPSILLSVAIPCLVLGTVIVIAKPLVFNYLLVAQGETKLFSREIGFRLGQNSEFALLVCYVAAGLLSVEASHVIQGATIFSLLVSTYFVVFRYPTPIALRDELRRD